MNRFATYDLETPANVFTACFKDFKTGKRKEFVIHESRNDLTRLVRFLRQLDRYNYWLIGFNCNQFDAQLLEYLLNKYPKLKTWEPERVAEKMHELANTIVRLPIDEKYEFLIPEWNFTIPHIDVYKQCHFDGKGKRCSLKWLEFTMRFPSIESMPFHHDTRLEEKDIASLLHYNINDVEATAEFFKRIKFETDLRESLSQEYNLHLINASEPKLARDIFGKFFCERMEIPYRELKQKRTYRSWIDVADVIFPYVTFRNPKLQKVKEWFQGLSFNPYYTVENSYKLPKKIQHLFNFHNLKGVVVGLGGIHGCIKPGIYESREDHIIEDVDVESYYPMLAILNEIYPEHLTKIFCEIYRHIFDKRKKIPKENPINYIFKIILNSTYGLSKEKNNYFHDPKYTYSITVNGQLLLLKLSEMLVAAVPDIIFYQFNTDGITLGYHPKHKDTVKAVISKWEKVTKLKMESKLYTKMVIVDVNNYLAVDTKGKVKRKGRFGYSMNPEDKEMAYHKNPSALIVPKALEKYFVHGIPYEKTIKECTDIFDFCHGVKLKDDFDLWMYWLNEEREIEKKQITQKVVRYYCSQEQCSIKKKYGWTSKNPNRIEELEKGYKITYYNTHIEKNINDYKIDYSYYIQRARDIVTIVQPNVNQITMF